MRRGEATTRVGRLHDIEQFSASRFLFLRFNFTTGDAAGQNLTGKATQRACAWIRAQYPGIKDFCLEANLATDKKSSHVNILRTRGKRVTAEATIPADLARQVMHTTPGQMFRARQISNLGSLLAGVNNNGNHSANGIAALFAATGQDIANVAESSAALVHTEVLADGSYYYSITIPALIVATYGGGTGLPTQREPTVIGDRRYADGGIRSSTSLSALSGTDVHEVYVLAPMASTEPDHPLQPHLRLERRLRQLLTRVLLRQAKALSAEGKRVTIVTPGPRDLAVMGANLMDPRRRPDVLEVSLRTSADSLATLDRVSSRAA